MNPERWQQIKSAFSAALQLEPAKRAAYVQVIGATDPELQQRVASLLGEHERVDDNFLKDPAIELEMYRDLIDSDADSWLGQNIGPYRLVQQLGAGGMGEVYLARREDAQFDQRVAIKLIRSGQDSAAVVNRFKAERQILAGLDHPNIARLLDGGRTAAGQPYFVMEYVPGPPITTYCQQKGLGIRGRLELVIQACDALQHAHQNAVIHRDLKPSNILVIEVDGKAVCRVIDFGLAKTTTPGMGDPAQLTRFGLFMGTPGYMSPEQADLSVPNVDTRTDVYSLGAVLYRLLTGFHPFESVDRQQPPFEEWLRQLREDTPPRPSSGRRALNVNNLADSEACAVEPGPLPSDLDWIVLKALERERERRYGTPAELAADLRRFLHDEPVLARPPSMAYQFGKFVRRHRVATGAVAAVVLSLVAGLSMALWQAHVAAVAARSARAQALAAQAQALKVQQMSALSAEQAADAANELGFASTALARLAYAVRLDPGNSMLRSHLLQLLDEQEIWWLPQQQSFWHPKVQVVQFSADGTRIATAAEDGSVIIWDLAAHRQSGAIHHQGGIFGLHFSPDGKQLVTGSADHSARVWDAATGKPLGPPLIHAAEIYDAHFSHDGRRVVTASADHTARVWDWRSGAAQGIPLRHNAAVYDAQFSPDDSRIVTASEDHTARVWGARSGLPISPPLVHGDTVGDAEFSSDGARVLTSSADSTARVWDARTGEAIGQPLRHARVVRQAKFSPDGSHVMSWSWDRTVRIWDTQTGRPLGQPVLLPLQVVEGFFSPDGRLAYTVVQDGTVRAWEVATGRPLGASVRLSSAEIMDADFNAQDNQLVTVSRDGGVQLWTPRPGAKLLNPLHQDNTFHFIKFSPDGRRVITDSAGHSATLWDPRSGTPLLAPLPHASKVLDAQFSDDGNRIATVAANRTTRIWNATTGAHVGNPMPHAHAVSEVKFSPDGTLLLTSQADGTVRLWDVATGEARAAPLFVGDQDSAAAGASFSPDGTRVAAAENQTKSGAGILRLWDVHSGQPIGAPMSHATAVSDWRFSPDGTRIVTISVISAALSEDRQARTIRLWNARTGAPLSDPLTYGGQLLPPMQFSPDGAYFLVATVDGKAQAWNAYTGALLDPAISQEAALTDVQISGDGERIVTASVDQTARVWNARTGAQIGVPLHHDGVVWSARFSADGKRIATGSGDRTAEVWDAQTLRPVTGPMRHEWPVRFALLSPDGNFVTTISVARDKRRLWPLLSSTADEAVPMADFAEAMGGSRVDASGALIPVQNRARELERLRTEFATLGKSPGDLNRIFSTLVPPLAASRP